MKKSQLIEKVIKSNVDKNYKYKNVFLRAKTKGKFTSGDLDLNEIIYVDENDPDDPQFVKDLEIILNQKRKLNHKVRFFLNLISFTTSDRQRQVRAAAKIFVRERTFLEYFDCSTPNTSESGPDQFELGHLSHISLVPAGLWDPRKPGYKPFKEIDANWLFFFFIARHFESLNVNGEKPKLVVKR